MELRFGLEGRQETSLGCLMACIYTYAAIALPWHFSQQSVQVSPETLTNFPAIRGVTLQHIWF